MYGNTVAAGQSPGISGKSLGGDYPSDATPATAFHVVGSGHKALAEVETRLASVVMRLTGPLPVPKGETGPERQPDGLFGEPRQIGVQTHACVSRLHDLINVTERHIA